MLDRLVTEKLAAEAKNVATEGWKWVEVWSGPDFEALARFGQAQTVEKTLSAERPRTRVLVGRDAKLRAGFERLPDRLRDRLYERMLLRP